MRVQFVTRGLTGISFPPYPHGAGIPHRDTASPFFSLGNSWHEATRFPSFFSQCLISRFTPYFPSRCPLRPLPLRFFLFLFRCRSFGFDVDSTFFFFKVHFQARLRDICQSYREQRFYPLPARLVLLTLLSADIGSMILRSPLWLYHLPFFL